MKTIPPHVLIRIVLAGLWVVLRINGIATERMIVLLTNKETSVLVTLKGCGEVLENVKGKLYFPENNEGPIRIELNMASKEGSILLDIFNSSNDSYLDYVEAIGSNEKFASNNARITNWTSYNSVYTEYKAIILAYELTRTVSLPGKSSNHCNITFWLNSNAIIPYKNHLNKRFDGTVEQIEAAKDLMTFKIADNLTFIFKKIYSYQDNENGYTAHSYKVCEVITDFVITNQETINTIIAQLEDFLLLVSFGYGNRVLWIGYEYSDENNYYEFYKGNILNSYKPKRANAIDINDWTVNDFIVKSYSRFIEEESNYVAIKSAIYALCNDNEFGIIDSKYLELFSAFESILLSFKKKDRNEKLLKVSAFKELSKEIELTINKYLEDNNYEMSLKESIVDKISELNRPSLKNTLQKFQKEYDLKLDNFWPFFTENREKPGLSDIRNKLIHGDYLYNKYDYLDYAKHQLRLILIVTIIKVLGWPIEQTRYTDESVKRECYYYPMILKKARENWKLNSKK